MAEAAEGSPPSAPVAARSRPISLRLRMLLLAGLVVVTALGLVGVAIDAANRSSAIAALQSRMESYVYLVLAAAEVNDSDTVDVTADLGDPLLSQPGSGVYVVLQGTAVRWASASSLGVPLPEGAEIPTGESQFSPPGPAQPFFALRYGIAWQLEGGGNVPFTVSVWVDAAELERNTAAFRLGLWRALLLAAVILLLAQGLMIFLGFQPLRRVASDVARVESGESAFLPGDYPRELEPLARNLNRLLATEKANQQRYRNALDSLAHSLKTPLAVLLAGIDRDTEESRAAMRKAVADMGYLVTTRLQRASALARRTMSPPVPVAPQVQRVLDNLGRVYAHRQIATVVDIPASVTFAGEQRDLLEILGNLLDNGFKYGRGQVVVHAGRLGPAASTGAVALPGGTWIEVEDDGPGIDPGQWTQLLKRGVRGDERAEGHGLGLAIVLELATAYGGTVDIARGDLGGARVRVELPAA